MAKKSTISCLERQRNGSFSDWDTVKKLVHEFEGAQYKSFSDEQEAKKAFKRSYDDYKGRTPQNHHYPMLKKRSMGFLLRTA